MAKKAKAKAGTDQEMLAPKKKSKKKPDKNIKTNKKLFRMSKKIRARLDKQPSTPHIEAGIEATKKVVPDMDDKTRVRAVKFTNVLFQKRKKS